MSEEAEFRGSGAFRVDRARALEKLSSFQLERGEQFLLPLARCAAAAGSRELDVRGVVTLKAVMDGRPFSRQELADPYGALFADDSDPRLRHFAAFLLGALRMRPKEIVVASGPKGSRFRLRIRDLSGEDVAPDAGPDAGTEVFLRWGGLRGFRVSWPAKDAARAAWAFTPKGFRLDGHPARTTLDDALESVSEAGGLTVRVAPPEDPAETRITLCSYGVAVETIKTLLPAWQVRAWVNDDAFSLTASQASVVEDERRQRALDAVAAAAAAFLPEAARRLTQALPEGWAASRAPYWAGAARSWFAETLRRSAAERRPAPDALWQTPFLEDASGRALCPVTLRREVASGGKAAYSKAKTGSARLPRTVAYCPRPEDRALLEALFPGALLDATQLIESLDLLK